MAGAVAGISAAWTAIGSFGGVIIGTAIQSAIIGAAIGGLSSAVMGGDIGKGMLFGSVGGAVMGGISGAFSTVSSASLSGVEGVTGSSIGAVGETTRGTLSGTFGTEATRTATTGLIEGGSKAFGIGKFFATEGGGTIGAGLVTTTGTTLAGAFDDTAEEQMKLEREKMELADKQFYANLEAQKEIANIRSSSGSASYDPTKVEMAKLAEQRRQFDTTTAIEQARRERQAASLGGLQAAKEAGVLSYQGVDTEIYNKNKPIYDQEANEPQGVLA